MSAEIRDAVSYLGLYSLNGPIFVTGACRLHVMTLIWLSTEVVHIRKRVQSLQLKFITVINVDGRAFRRRAMKCFVPASMVRWIKWLPSMGCQVTRLKRGQACILSCVIRGFVVRLTLRYTIFARAIVSERASTRSFVGCRGGDVRYRVTKFTCEVSVMIS